MKQSQCECPIADCGKSVSPRNLAAHLLKEHKQLSLVERTYLARRTQRQSTGKMMPLETWLQQEKTVDETPNACYNKAVPSRVCPKKFIQLVYTGKKKKVMAAIKGLCRMDILGRPKLDPYVMNMARYMRRGVINVTFLSTMKQVGDALSASLCKILRLLQGDPSEVMTALLGKTLVLLSLLLRSIRESFRRQVLSELNIRAKRNVKYVQDSAFVFGNVLATMITQGQSLNANGQPFVSQLPGWKRRKFLSICLKQKQVVRFKTVQDEKKGDWEMFCKSCIAHGITTEEWRKICKETSDNVQIHLPRPSSIENSLFNFDRCSQLISETLQTLSVAYGVADVERTTTDILSVGRFVRVAYTFLVDISSTPCSEMRRKMVFNTSAPEKI